MKVGSKEFVYQQLANKSRQKYINNYNKENYAVISFRMRKDKNYYRFKEILKNNNVGISEFFKGVIEEFLEFDLKK